MYLGRVALALAALITLSSRAAAQEYYIDADQGRDENDGLAPETAKQTLASVAGGFGSSYDAVYLKAGTNAAYETDGINVANAIVSRYGPETAERPVIAGTGTGFGGVTVGSNGVLQGVKVIGSGRVGISVMGPGAEVSDCEVDGSTGFFELGFGIMGEGNYVHHNIVHHLSAMSGDTGDMNTSGGAEAYMVMGSDNEIAYNVALEAHGLNETLGGSEGGCLEIVNGTAGATISGVSFHHNYCEQSVGLFEGCSGNFSGSDKIQENHGIIRDSVVAYNISVDAMWLYLLQPVNTDFYNLVFEHNTIIHTPNNHLIEQAARDMFGLNVEEDQGYGPTPLQPGAITVRNNIFAVVQGASTGFGGISMGNVPDADHYNNLFVGADPSWALGAGELVVDEAGAGFTADYRLAAGSAAIDAGAAQAWQAWTDFDGNAVPLGAAPDIGASEYCDAATTACNEARPGGTGGAGTGGASTGGASTGGASTGGGSAGVTSAGAGGDGVGGSSSGRESTGGVSASGATNSGGGAAIGGATGAGGATRMGGSVAAGQPTQNPSAGAEQGEVDSGCGCAVVGRQPRRGEALLAGLSLLMLAERRRRAGARR